MKPSILFVVAALLTMTAAVHGHRHRRLLEPRGIDGQGIHVKGAKFHFPRGKSRQYIDDMDQEHLQKLMERAHFNDRSALAHKLDTDSDLVSQDAKTLAGLCCVLRAGLLHSVPCSYAPMPQGTVSCALPIGSCTAFERLCIASTHL
jgi:hypothetical protein